MLALAIDLGGSHASGALMSESGIVAQCAIPVTAQSFQDVLMPLEAMVASLLSTANVGRQDCHGLVLGFPGAVNSRAGRVIATNQKFNDAIGFDFREWAQQRFGWRMVLENDVRLALIGEHSGGAARDTNDAVMIALGTGIGTAVFIDGVPLRGQTNQAGSLGGHLPVRLNGRPCTCGGRGCAEAEASTWALPLVCRDWPGFSESLLAQARVIDFRALFHAKDAGDRTANEVFEHCMDIWTALAVAMTHAYSPQVIVLGGGVLARADDILPALTARLGREAWSPGGYVTVRASALGSSAAFHGTIPTLQEISSE